MKKYRMLSILMGVSLFINSISGFQVQAAQQDDQTEQSDEQSAQPEAGTVSISTGTGAAAASYFEYVSSHRGAEQVSDEIIIPAADFSGESGSDSYIASYQGRDQVLYWDSQHGMVTWEFDVAKEGFYDLQLEYCLIACKNYDITYNIYLDGVLPYENAKSVPFRRMFMDDTWLNLTDNSFEKDTAGNEIRPAMTEVFKWTTAYATDPKNQVTDPISFYLEKGHHSISLELTAEAAALYSLRFSGTEGVPSYSVYRTESGGEQNAAEFSRKYEAEKSYQKNDITLFATYDIGSVFTTPSSPTKTMYNTIGKNTWNEVGEQITWQIEAPEDGYYCFSFKVKQNEKSNAYSVRSMTIDGESLFQEMEEIRFSYESGWYMKEFADAEGTPYQIYLTKGTHILGMEAVMDAEFADLLRRVDEINDELETWYREIVKITGINADAERITVDTNRDFRSC